MFHVNGYLPHVSDSQEYTLQSSSQTLD